MALSGNAQPPNRQQPGKYKPNKQAHVANTKYGMGDSYGMGVKQKIGRMRDSYTPPVNVVPAKKLKKPPRGLA
jgi:hypothetical protein